MQTRRDLLFTLAGMAAMGSAGAANAAAMPLSVAKPVAAPAPAFCHAGHARLAPLRAAMARGRFIAYHPTGIAFWYGHAGHASTASIRADLKALRPWFDGLITYAATNGAEHVADVAASLGYRAVIQGVWDPDNRHEIARALAAWKRHPRLVAGISLGNEVVLSGRGTWGDLAYALGRVRQLAPGLPLTTTEPFAQFVTDVDATSTLAAMDFMMVNIHPIFERWFRRAQPANWAEFVTRATDMLAAKYCGPILVKETGVPSGPSSSGYTADMQRAFYRALEARMKPDATRAFAYFSAFDLPWHAYNSSPTEQGKHPEEAHWGFFTDRRMPKPVVADLARLPIRPG